MYNLKINFKRGKMMTISEQDKKKFINKAIAATNIYSTPLVHNHSDIKQREIGSGTFAIIGNTKGVLTNAHVAKIFEEFSYFSVPDPNQTATIYRMPYVLSINLPALKQFPDVDMSFLVLDPRAYDIVIQIGKQFWNLDQSVKEVNNTFSTNTSFSMFLIHGNVAEGARLIYDPTTLSQKTQLYPNAGPYIVAPDLNNIESGTCTYEGLRNGIFKVDKIVCPINTKDKMPNNFSGMSGGALWQIIFDTDDNVQRVILTGIATAFGRHEKKAEWLECRGPITLYQSFYLFCLGAIYADSLYNRKAQNSL